MWSPGGTQGSPKHAWKNPWNVMIPGQDISTSAPLFRNFSVADLWLQHEVQHLNCTQVPPRPAHSYLSISGPLLKDNTGRAWRSTLCSSKADNLNYHPTRSLQTLFALHGPPAPSHHLKSQASCLLFLQSGERLLFSASQQPLHTHMSDCSRCQNKQNLDTNPLGTGVGRIMAPPVFSNPDACNSH